jgi:signal transduction histidine kinase
MAALMHTAREQDHDQRSIRWIIGATILMVAAAMLGSVALMLVAARTLDHIESLDERSLVQRTLNRDLTRMTRELTSATVWDDAVDAFAGPIDAEWADANFGEYYNKYFNHDLTFVVRDGHVIYGAIAGARAGERALGALPADATILTDRVKGLAQPIHDRGGRRLEAASTAAGLISSGDEIYLVVASDILADTPRVAEHDTGPPAVVVSARRVSSAYVRGLRGDLGIEGLTLTDRPAAGQITVPLRDPRGRVIGAATWPPTEPGMNLLRHAAPWIGAVFLALAACAGILFLRVGDGLRGLNESRKALIVAKDSAEAANVAKTQFLALMSHEIRTPLNGVLGMTQVMQADDLPARQRDRLEVVAASGQALLALLNDILDMARLDGRKLFLKVKPFVVEDLVEDACALFSGAASSKGIELRWEIEPVCRGAWIGDPVRLRQVLSNLIANAIKFTARGHIVVRIAPALEGLRFEIEDTGVGISPADLPRLFKMFSQIDGSSTRQHEGSGLGLAISHDLVALMGGTMGIESVLGTGSLFHFEIPLPRARPALRLVGEA